MIIIENLMLEMDNITKTFPGVVALDNVKLHLKSGTVHALMGENGAGKSTLMKCLFGIYQKDSGNIKIQGSDVFITSSKQALDLGISMIHQELYPIPYRSVMENIWLGRFPKQMGFLVNKKEMKQKTIELFKQLEIKIDPNIDAGNLSISNLQLLEIAKAVSYNSKIIIMDEPTSSLTETEVDYLFKIINKLKDEGRSIIYISHKMDEILKISDEVTIMRDGKYVGTWDSKDLTTDLIINKMVGRDLTEVYPKKDYTPSSEDALNISNFTSANPKHFKDINVTIKKGEVFGIGGLVGSGRTEFVEALFGLSKLQTGVVKKDGTEIKIKKPNDAIKNKFALLTEDRRGTGIFGVLSVLDNTVIANLKFFSSFDIINHTKKNNAASNINKKLKVKTASIDTLIKNLSGGNQQKVLIARWLLTEPDILILDEPTRGIDVGAKYEIYTIINDLAKIGKTVIMISSEMPELMGMSDRIMVMSEGKLTGVLNKEDATQVKIMELASIQSKK